MVKSQFSKLVIVVFAILLFGVFLAEAANVSITKTMQNTSSIYVNDELSFLINVTNNDPSNLTGYQVIDSYDQTALNYTASSYSLDYDNQSNGEIGWYLPNMTTNQSYIIQVNFTANASGNTYNVASVENSTPAQEANDSVIFDILTSGGTLQFNVVKQDTNPQGYTVGDNITFFINISNTGSTNITTFNMTDLFNSSCMTYTGASELPNSTGNGTINWTDVNSTLIETGSFYTIFVNFTFIKSCTNETNSVNVTVSDDTTIASANTTETYSVSPGMGGGPNNDWDEGLSSWESQIETPYIVQNGSQVMNFSLTRQAGDDSCLQNLTVTYPSNITFTGYNSSSISASNYTFSHSANTLLWAATSDDFFCGSGPEDFLANFTSTDDIGADKFVVIASNLNNETSNLNMTFFTTYTFDFPGAIFDVDGQPLGGAVASITVASYSQDGDTTFGTFTAVSNASGNFTILNVPGVGNMGQGMPFYRLSAAQYNDSTNNYAMYVGPSLPDLPEVELRSPWGLANPEIYLRPAFTFHVMVEGYDYKSGPINDSGCPENCLFNWTNISFAYGLKDTKLGFPVTEEFTSRSTEKYFAAPRERNYTLMLFPDSSFPINLDFANLDTSCSNATANISQTGVDATCTIDGNGSYVVDATIASNMTLARFNGTVNETSLDSFFIVVYMFEAGNMIFDQGTLPFNMGNMMQWPANATLNDQYNLSAGSFNITLPATMANSNMLLMAYARKGSTYYRDVINISATGQSLSSTDYQFQLVKLIDGADKAISTQNVSADWNDTTIVNTTAVEFTFVNSTGGVLSDESPFVEFTLSMSGISVKRMTEESAVSDGVFSIPLQEGDGISKMQIFSQSYAPISQSIPASILTSGGSSGKVACVVGACNITLSSFDPFDPETNQSLDVMMDLVVSNSTCDVPSPPAGCSFVADQNKSAFSPFKAILRGDVSLRIKSGNVSVHYTNTDLLASGPPDASFSQNASGDSFAEAWKFGSTGPEIYQEVLLSMPFNASFENDTLNISIPLLYDNEFNIIWNISDNTTSTLVGTDYSDYLGNAYEAYLNGTNVTCNATDTTLSAGLCYQDNTNHLIWMKIPHFSGVGPVVSSSSSTSSGVNITIVLSALNTNYTVGQDIEYELNITNTDSQNISVVWTNATYNQSLMRYTSSYPSLTSNNSGTLFWSNVLSTNLTPGANASVYFNMTSLVASSVATMTVVVNATAADATTGQTSTLVNVTILAVDSTAPTVTLNSPTTGSSSSATVTTVNVSVLDTVNISNVSLYGNWNGTWMINQTNSSGDNNVSYLFNVSLGTGVYTWNAYACDGTGNCAWATANYTYTIDQDAPVITFTLPSNTTNVSSGTNVSFAFTTDENVTGNYTYDADVTSAFSNTASVSGTLNGSLNRSVLLYGIVPNGDHNITVLAADSLGNLATYMWNFTVYDTTAPNVTSHTITGNATSQSSGTTTITMKVDEHAYCYISTNSSLNVSTNISAAGGVPLAGSLSNLSNSLTYSFVYNANATKGPYYVACKDSVPNNMTSVYTIPAFAVKIIPADDDDDSSSSSNTPSSTPYFDATYIADTDDLDEGYSKILSLTKRVKFKVGIENHYLAINEIKTNEVTINVTSTLQQATIKEGESAKFELTNDTYYDVLVTLEDIDGDEVNISMENIHELIVEEEPEEEVEEEIETLTNDAPVAVCGDGVADTGENCTSCPADVVCGEGLTCLEGSCVEEQSEPPLVEKETDVDGWKIAGIIIWIIAIAFGLYWYFVLKNPPKKPQKHPSQPHAVPKEPPHDAHKKFEHQAVHTQSHYGGKKVDPQQEHHESNYHRQNH